MPRASITARRKKGVEIRSVRHNRTVSRLVRGCVLLAAVLAVFSVAFVFTIGRANASAFTVTTNTTFPISITLDACGNEFTVSGNLHDLFHVTFDGAGGLHLDALDNPQGISGSDLAGNKYQGTGLTRSDVNEASVVFPLNETFINRFDMIGQGQAPNYEVHETFHVTVNAGGTLTSFHDNFSITCK
jgi:hypothetical protein